MKILKHTLLTLICTLFVFTASADEGMWLPSLIGPRIKQMREKGFRLTAEDVYSINKASMKDAVVLFGGGCTGELISADGLLLTNHHCGYDNIQAHSTVENDYLTSGFLARSRSEELPNEGLNVRFLVRMDDVTDRIASGQSQKDIVAAAEKDGRYKASVEQMYYGNQYFLFVYEQFDDVRLVCAPPSSIGKFGGDTDNWMWPRHTGDFSMFRIYANKDNQPAKYSPDNVPYHPKKFFTISTKGVKEGDFTMIYGFPGTTQEYLISDAVDYIATISDPTKIRIRTKRLDIIAEAQAADPAMRIRYAATHAYIANAWKKWQGEALGINKVGTVAKKRKYEQAFEAWAQDKPEYRNVVQSLKREYARIVEPYFAYELLKETILTEELMQTVEEQQLGADMFRKVTSLDSSLLRSLYREYYDHSPKEYLMPHFAASVERFGSPEAYADYMLRATHRRDSIKRSPELDSLQKSAVSALSRIVDTLGVKALRNLNSDRLNALYTTYIKGLGEWDTQRAFYPDANLTLRVAYGTVSGYQNADGEYHTPFTTIDGIVAKDDPTIHDYNIPQLLRDVYASDDYGRWGVEIDGKITVPVCFLATNHTTGGNSGSPVLNGRGELVGINFDRTWRSTMSDIEFDPDVCRNISVDIRYVLFVIDKIGGASYLLDEMRLK